MTQDPPNAQRPYHVEVEVAPCITCRNGALYCVVGPDRVALGTSYYDQDDANDICEILNDAYELGSAAHSRKDTQA